MALPSVSDGRRSFVQDAISLLLNRFTVMGLAMISGVIIARCLGSEGRGVIAAALVYPAMFLSLVELGVRQSSIYFLGKKLFTELEVVGAVTSLIMLTGLLGLLVAAGILYATGNPSFTPPVIALAAATVPLSLVKTYSSGILLGKRLVGQFVWIERMAEVLRLALVACLVWALAVGVVGALSASVLASALVAAFALKRVAQIAPLVPSFDWRVIRALLTKGLVYATALFVLTLNYKLDIALMERWTSTSEIGLYTTAMGIAQLTWALPEATTTALFSHSATAHDETAFSHKVARLFRVSLVVSGVLIVLLAVAAPHLIPIVYGSEFAGSILPLRILFPGVFCFLALKIFAVDLAGRGRPNVSLYVTVPCLLINGLLNAWLVPYHGACGAAVASSVSYSLAGLGLMLIYSRVTGMCLADLWRYKRSDFEFLTGFLAARRGKKIV